MGVKHWTTGRVWSTKYSRYVHTYTNTAGQTFQTGTIGEFAEEVFPDELFSPDCLTTYSNVRAHQVFTKNDCTSGESGTTVDYIVAAGTYTSTISQANADAQAAADIATNGQANANLHGMCFPDSTLSTLLIDYETDTTANLCVYVKTTGLDESGVFATGTILGGPLEQPNDGRDPAASWFLSSDMLSGGSPAWRFGINLAYFIVKYTGVLTVIDFEVRGRSSLGLTVAGSYAARDISEGVLELVGPSGSRIPAVTMGSSSPIGYSSNIVSGADGTMSLTTGSPILTLRYDFGANTLAATTY